MYYNNFSLWVLVPPTFVAEPESQAAVPKSAVLLRSVFEGTPPFTVKWFKDDVELISGLLCMISLQEYSSSLELNSVGTLQSGTYSCQVSNEAGTVKSSAEVLVTGWTALFFLSTTTVIACPITPSFFLHFTAHLSSFSFSPPYHLFSFQIYLRCPHKSHLSTSSICHIGGQVLI